MSLHVVAERAILHQTNVPTLSKLRPCAGPAFHPRGSGAQCSISYSTSETSGPSHHFTETAKLGAMEDPGWFPSQAPFSRESYRCPDKRDVVLLCRDEFGMGLSLTGPVPHSPGGALTCLQEPQVYHYSGPPAVTTGPGLL